jgi:hypothetical protein
MFDGLAKGAEDAKVKIQEAKDELSKAQEELNKQ